MGIIFYAAYIYQRFPEVIESLHHANWKIVTNDLNVLIDIIIPILDSGLYSTLT